MRRSAADPVHSSAAATRFAVLRALICLMFLCFAMTTDAVGSVIPQLIGQFGLSLKAAGAFHYVPMSAIAVGALLLGFLADRLGRKPTILLGLALYGASSVAFAFSDRFPVFLGLLAVAGLAVSLFKIGALALIGDISDSTTQHASNMNLIEGCFGVGSILGPALVGLLLQTGVSWKWLYVTAAVICGVLILFAASANYPAPAHPSRPVNLARTLVIARSRYSLGFSVLIMAYVATEVAVYVWMPTYLRAYRGTGAPLVPYALTTFFVLRAAGRFVGAFTMRLFSWSAVLTLFSLGILVCFGVSLLEGPSWGLFALPLSGLFMSIMYPTLNSKGISCFDRSEHGSAAGILLFFTALSAAGAPFAMAVVSDLYGDASYGFGLAAVFALILFVGLLINLWFNPADRRLEMLNGRGCAAGTG